MNYLALFILGCPFMVLGQQAQISQVIEEQVVCWNSGDLECYMEGYWKSDELMFIGKTGITYGWDATLDKYRKSYPDKQTMGQLDLSVLEIIAIGANVYLVVGRWALSRSIGDLEGHFSLIFK
ncbi:MAG: DUF4440 domain-containing protein, partial [Marinoscillum sp.]